MNKSRLIVIALLLVLFMGSCWRGYRHGPRYSYAEGQECASEDPDDCRPTRGSHGCGMW